MSARARRSRSLFSSSSSSYRMSHKDKHHHEDPSYDKDRQCVRKDRTHLSQRYLRKEGQYGDDRIRRNRERKDRSYRSESSEKYGEQGSRRSRKRKDRSHRSESLTKYRERKDRSHRSGRKKLVDNYERKDYSKRSYSPTTISESDKVYERSETNADRSLSHQSSQEAFQEGDVQLNEATLKILGDNLLGDEKISGKVHNVLIEKWTRILRDGLKEETLEELLAKYSFPKEFEAIHPPSVNPEVKHLLGESGAEKDSFQVIAQNKFGTAIYAIGLALTTIFNDGGEMNSEITSNLSDAGRILSDVHYNVSIMRRAFITPKVNYMVKDLTQELPIGKVLFGEDLSSRVKVAKEVEKSSKDLIKSSTSNNRSEKSSQSFHQKRPNLTASYKTSLNTRGLSRGNYKNRRWVHQNGPRRGTQQSQYRRRC